MKKTYSEDFFKNINRGSYLSALEIFKILGQYIRPASMLDIGCGPGSWIRAATEVFAIPPSEIVGLDGSYSRPMHQNLSATFIYQDLSRPLGNLGKCDLVVCVEVAEHLPKERAASLVQEICFLGRAVVFGAAVPGQGGTGHINEQWPDYWISLFRENGFDTFDLFRKKVWLNNKVEPWYAQNTFLFVRRGDSLCDQLAEYGVSKSSEWELRIVHPGIFRLAACESAGALRLIRALPGRLISSILSRYKKLTKT